MQATPFVLDLSKIRRGNTYYYCSVYVELCFLRLLSVISLNYRILFVKLIKCHVCDVIAYLHCFMYLFVSMSTSCVSQGMYADTAGLQRSHYSSTLRFQHMACLHSAYNFIFFWNFLIEWVHFPLLPESIISALLRTEYWRPQYSFNSLMSAPNSNLFSVVWPIFHYLHSRERLFFLILIVTKFIEFNIMWGSFIYFFYSSSWITPRWPYLLCCYLTHGGKKKIISLT